MIRQPIRLLAITSIFFLAVGSSGLGAPPAERLQVVARNLDNPRKLEYDRGALYVVEAGHGGRDRCVGRDVTKVCVGRTGALTRIAGSTRAHVVTGLLSVAAPDGHRAQGPVQGRLGERGYEILLQDGVIDARGRNSLGPDGALGGDLVLAKAGAQVPMRIADLAAFEVSHNPDRGAGPGRRFGNPPLDSDPYGFVAYKGGWAVVDAAANDLLWVSPTGKVSVLTVFPTQRVALTLATQRGIGAPPTMRSILVQSVPTSVALGPDGALYVGELTGAPFAPGSARIWRVTTSGRSLFASGFTSIADLAFAGRDLLVLELASRGLLDPSSPGALIRLGPDGSRTVLASTGLVVPTGVTVGDGAAYVSNFGLSPAAGAGPHGEIVRIPLQ